MRGTDTGFWGLVTSRAEALLSHAQGCPNSAPLSVTQKPGWLVQLCLLAPIYDFFFFFCKERNIRKTFALTLNPPPHVTVIAGPGGRKRKYHSNLGPTSLDNIVLNLLKSWSQAAASPPRPPAPQHRWTMGNTENLSWEKHWWARRCKGPDTSFLGHSSGKTCDSRPGPGNGLCYWAPGGFGHKLVGCPVHMIRCDHLTATWSLIGSP